MYIYNHIFIHLSVDGHLGGFHILAIINNAAINFEVHGSFLIKFFFFLDVCTRMGLLGHIVVLFLAF